MVSFEEAGVMLDKIVDDMPAELFRELNGGVNLLPEEKLHPDSREPARLYILGQYHNEVNGLGRYITIFYGSFCRMYPYVSPEALERVLRRTLYHEFTHHLESLAGERGLEIEDAKTLTEYKRKFKNE